MSTTVVRLWMVRHGQTEANIMGVIQGHSDWPLTETGIDQARISSERLRRINFRLAYSSDLKRASQTLDTIVENVACEVVEYRELLRERCYGAWQGRTLKDIAEHAQANGFTAANMWLASFEGGETDAELSERAEQFYSVLLDDIRKAVNTDVHKETDAINPITRDEAPAKKLNVEDSDLLFDDDDSTDGFNVLLVTHTSWMRKFVKLLASKCGPSSGHQQLIGLSNEEMNNLPISNCSITCFQIEILSQHGETQDEEKDCKFLLLNYNPHAERDEKY